MRIFREAFALWCKARREKSTSLQIRLFAFFALLVFVLISTFILILMLTGVFGGGEREYRIWAETEMEHLTNTISADFGKLSIRGTEYAGTLSFDIERWLKKHGVSANTIAAHPELLEDLLSDHASGLVTVMQNNNCTGAFLMLNATVNPSLPDAENSRAGMFFKRTEQNTIGIVNSKVFYLRGPARISRETGIEMIGLWEMEFNISEYNFYDIVMDTAHENGNLPLSRLYYWANHVSLDGSRDPGMLLCVPLIASDGTVFGMFGFELSPMLFKLRYSPDNSRYSHIFALLAPVGDGVLDTDFGLIAGNSYLTAIGLGKIAEVSGQDEHPHTFKDENGGLWVGLQSPVKLYPSLSPYEGEEWSLAMMLPKEDYRMEVTRPNRVFYGAVVGLLAVSLLLAYSISKRYIRPIVDTLHLIRNETIDELQRTRIVEIDDLLDFLAAQDERRKELESALYTQLQGSQNEEESPAQEKKQDASSDFAAYLEFKRNIETLSKAERAVFNLYMIGHKAKEISEILNVSINTIKTHNRRIYTKLNVTSRKELMVYVQMMSAEIKKEEQHGND